MKVRKLARNKNKKVDSTDLHLRVEAKEANEEFEKSKITEALIKEANVEEKIAKQIANEVERRLLELETENIPVSLIRDFVNVELAREGLEKKLTNQRVIGLPVFDLENYLYEKSNENSNIAANNPEAVNLFLAETILKEYALNHVFGKEISDAHRSGKIHLHDLGLVIRAYAFGKDGKIIVRNKKDKISLSVNFEELFNLINSNVFIDNEVSIKQINDYEILDKNNTWVDLLRIVKHDIEKDMIEIETENNKIRVTTEHPCIVFKNDKEIIKRADELEEGDFVLEI